MIYLRTNFCTSSDHSDKAIIIISIANASMATIAHRDIKYFHACVLQPHPAGYMCPCSTCDESFPPTTSVDMTLWLAASQYIILPLIFIQVAIELNSKFWIWNNSVIISFFSHHINKPTSLIKVSESELILEV